MYVKFKGGMTIVHMSLVIKGHRQIKIGSRLIWAKKTNKNKKSVRAL